MMKGRLVWRIDHSHGIACAMVLAVNTYGCFEETQKIIIARRHRSAWAGIRASSFVGATVYIREGGWSECNVVNNRYGKLPDTLSRHNGYFWILDMSPPAPVPIAHHHPHYLPACILGFFGGKKSSSVLFLPPATKTPHALIRSIYLAMR